MTDNFGAAILLGSILIFCLTYFTISEVRLCRKMKKRFNMSDECDG